MDHHVAWEDFHISCINGNGNEYFTEELEKLQLYANCVSTLPGKTYTLCKCAYLYVYE